MNRNELLRKLNMLFPRFNERIEEKGLAEISKTFCLFVSMGLSQNSQILKSKAERMKEENKFRYELIYRMELLWRKLDMICVKIQSIDFDIIDGAEITDAMLERTYNLFSALNVMLQTEMDKSLKFVNLLWISMKGICYEEGTQTV